MLARIPARSDVRDTIRLKTPLGLLRILLLQKRLVGGGS